jgi:hypothetical protein
MPFFLTPELFLALGKVTSLLLVTLTLSRFLRNPIHRARLLSFSILLIPLVFFTSFLNPFLELIPLKAESPSNPASPASVASVQDAFGEKILYRSFHSDPSLDLWNIQPDQQFTVEEAKEFRLFPYPQPGISTESHHEARKISFGNSTPVELASISTPI